MLGMAGFIFIMVEAYGLKLFLAVERLLIYLEEVVFASSITISIIKIMTAKMPSIPFHINVSDNKKSVIFPFPS
jgi:hypothetical protein